MKIKQKTKKSISKRVIETGSGKLKRKQAFRSHLAHNKTTKQKRHSRKDVIVDRIDASRYKKLLQN
ncbi:MAG: 50S ribosomal protein L35 [Malacoplasma sp.]|nr:50S ribosomal protein L35 [Malacoplasma sp.]